MAAYYGPIPICPPESGYTSNDAINFLALDVPLGTQLYVHSFVVPEGGYSAAPNSIPGTFIVEAKDEKPGGGIEFVSRVELEPYTTRAAANW